MTENKRFAISGDRSISDHHKERLYDLSNFDGVISVNECMNELNNENQRLQKENKILYDENIQLRNKLLHFIQLKDDVKYLEEKGVF